MGKLSEYEQKIISVVEKHGWMNLYVFDPDERLPDFSYSIGFTQTLNAPEFIVFGLPKEIMSHMLWEAFRQIRDGAKPHDGMRWAGMLEGFDCISRKVHPSNLVPEYLNSANWFWHKHMGHEEPLNAYQLVWPSSHSGLYPWDDEVHPDVIAAQPQLWLPNKDID